MRKLIMWNVISLDGYFEGEKNWDLPWHEQVWGEELEQFSIEQLQTTDALVFGRVTYEGMAAYWPTAKGKGEIAEIAEYMNTLPKVVCSNTLKTADWNNSTLASGDAAAAVAKLKEQGNGNLFVFGSAILSATLINANLFDEYRIGIAPVIHGEGRPLFPQGLNRLHLALHETRALSNGCILAHYRPKPGA